MAALGHTLAALLFLAMAALQLNDPDPVLWVVVYLAIATAPIGKLVKKQMPNAVRVTLGLIVAALLISLPGFIDYLLIGDFASITAEMSGDRPYVEGAREFIGTSMGAVCLGYYWSWHTRLTNDE